MAAFQEEEYKNSKIDLKMWRKLMVYALPHKKNLILVALFMLCSAATDVINPLLTARIVNVNIMGRTWEGISLWIVLAAILVVVQGVNIFGFIYNAGRAEIGIMCTIRDAGFTKLQELSFSYFDRTAVGYIMARMTSDASRLAETISWSMVDVLWSVGYMLMAATAMLIYDAKLGLLVLCTVPLIAVISTFFQKRMLAAWRNVRRVNSKITGAFNEGITGARTTKTLVREELNNKEFRANTTEMRDSSVHAAVMSNLFWPLIMSIGTIGTSLILWMGGKEVLMGTIRIGDFNFFMQLGSWFFEPVNNLARIFAELQSSQAAVERLIGLLTSEPDIQDTPEVIEKYGDAFNAKRENWSELRGDVVFENVSFAYKEGQEVLKDFNLTIQAGQKIALVGETGSGKSTIVNLICRFYEPTKGRILIDGVDYRERSQIWLHSNLGYVLQTPHLFSGTIRDNIRYGRLDATDEEVEEAAKLVDAHSFIIRLEKGYDTEVGEGGGRLSTGEKQLVSFARAILANPALFVLDEATSSIDTETEQTIQRAIEKVLSGRTSFLIAHRLSTIRSADRILVIRKGVVTEQGTHKELMRLKGYYYNLYTTQFKEEANEQILGKMASKFQTQE